ncbi:hypothetical protein EJB00_01740 [Wolbachia endosymbiont of Drosophila mauritiana]|uniref:hypothetical protein n=1 Tax=unclassified Wolbachia TaxID=2640676 RepID=UPI00107ECFB4|nr:MULTISPECIES: hypothetical protein [unclassified Wolbachia]QCB62387.1 hypothetical protein EJA99_01745 [Wolbachia endosymbiont of Drosophila mauritiana]QCB63434.1 hypothetical protein EJB00_01740 [Wolbachia endosymbiont of Drosophila mauritiana]QWE33302.1 Uncharacterized protein WwMa_03890 [Wolbachia endosymbiont of Drosophila simulans]TGB06729.1 hypothetical protein E5C28_03060 [Wolbachia endosymbiont of Drosophila mauritiana]
MSISKERKEYLLEKFKYAAKEFGKSGTKSNHLAVPKEQQLSIDLGNRKVFGIINKILYWIENNFTYFFPRYNLFPEVGVEGRKIPGTNTRVKYFTPDDQAEYTIIPYKGKLYVDLMPEVEGNKLKGFKGKLYDTTDKISKGKKGYVAYVITLDGKLVTHEHINVNKSEWAYRYSTLAGGRPVLCSGLMKVVNGKITYIDNNSGHYKPEPANLYNAVKKLEGLFSEDAKVVCLSYWISLKKQIPLIRKITLAKREPVEEFLKRMEKKGKDGLTQYERHFKRVKEFNEKYSDKLESQSVYAKVAAHDYKSVPVSDCSNPQIIKMAVEHSIRRIIGANYGHKPKLDIKYDQEEAVGVNVIFHYKDDRSRFVGILDLHKCSYSSRIQKNKYIITMSIKQADEFIKDALQIKIDSVEQLDTRLVMGLPYLNI